MKSNKVFTIAMTGASGAPLAIRFLSHLKNKDDVELFIIPSRPFLKILQIECGIDMRGLINNYKSKRWHWLNEDDLTAPISSGSFRTDGMIIIPASMGTCGAIASGTSRDLIQRSADVTLKEGRTLIIVPRETPLSLIHLKNLVTLREAGAIITPFIPAFYSNPETINDLMDSFVQRLYDHINLNIQISKRWK